MKTIKEILDFLTKLENRDYKLKGKHPTLGEEVIFANIRVALKSYFRWNKITTDPIAKVEEFHKLIGAKIGNSPDLIPSELVKFRHKFMKEENNEYIAANQDQDLVDVLDALVDMQYFLLGTVVNHGLQDVFWPAFSEVHRSNMTKKANGNLKAIKGKGYSPPDLLSILISEDDEK